MDIKVDKSCRYTETHEWVRVEGGIATVGITDYAQDQLGDIVYVEMPMVGDTFEKGESFAVAESVKATSDCYMPLSGEITEVNEELTDSPELVNGEPYGKGWFVKFKPSNLDELDELLTPKEYEKHAAAEAEKGGH